MLSTLADSMEILADLLLYLWELILSTGIIRDNMVEVHLPVATTVSLKGDGNLNVNGL